MFSTTGPIRIDARGNEVPATVLVTYSPRLLVELPVVSITCSLCGKGAMPGRDGVEVCRVKGDSRYGYETYHASCSEAFYAPGGGAYEPTEPKSIELEVTYLTHNDVLGLGDEGPTYNDVLGL